ncbi:MAG TPA: hypothetical protein VFR15_04485 [Chloroflexia bacterium]|nr:hypothetical protein [Chloroflexia bacterium]
MDNDNRASGTHGEPPTGSDAAADHSDAMKGKEPLPTAKPSQAEGERETVEQAVEEHEASGEL